MQSMISKMAYVIFAMAAAQVAASFQTAAAVRMQAVVDATELPRGLLTAKVDIPAKGGRVGFLYPEWIEGVHGPSNPIQNLAGFEVTAPDGSRVPWQRDPRDIYRFEAKAKAAGARRVRVRTTYICNQPSDLSMGIDSYGTTQVGIINWNTCLVYPAGESIYDIEVELTLQLPEGWSWASSLRAKKETDDGVVFEPVTFQELMDSPLICGEQLRTYDITASGRPMHRLAVVSESRRMLNLEDETVQKLKELVEQACRLFGDRHDYPYTFLLVLSDNLPFIGLEHLRSSLNVVGEEGLSDAPQAARTGQLLAHEFGHRWCGKYHRPAGMDTNDYNTPKDTRLLWVYEGLDQYLGVVLAARSGWFATDSRSSFEGALQDEWMGIGHTLVRLTRQKGRRIMNLEDTAASSYIRRSRSKNWETLRRPQDYYFEGALLWYEIDAILRHESHGEITLDDFIERFLGRYDPDRPLMPYQESDLIEWLNELHPYDWRGLIDKRVRGFQQRLPLKVLSRLGYRIVYAPEPTDYDTDPSLTSLGMSVDENGIVQTVVPGSVADSAKLAEGVKVIGVNGKKYSANRLKDAIAESPVQRHIELLILKGELFETVKLPYDEGPQYMDLVRNPDQPDLLKEILAQKKPLHPERLP